MSETVTTCDDLVLILAAFYPMHITVVLMGFVLECLDCPIKCACTVTPAPLPILWVSLQHPRGAKRVLYQPVLGC